MNIPEKELKKRKGAGENIQKYLESIGYPQGTPDVIELSYDLQAGDDYDFYINNREFKNNFIDEIFHAISPFIDCNLHSILDCGTGEGASLIPFLRKCKELPDVNIERVCACDLSSKRLSIIRDKFGENNICLVRAYMRMLPFLDNDFDIVTTFHSIEPNYVYSSKIFTEIIRVARKYVIMIEPIYEWANAEQKTRMDDFKYFRGLPEFLDNNKSIEVLLKHQMNFNANPLNRAHLIMIKKK